MPRPLKPLKPLHDTYTTLPDTVGRTRPGTGAVGTGGGPGRADQTRQEETGS